ncbi:helix-turn-helix domain-containing protein [Pseudonocardia kujensis]|uniref:helix-turn-helix domain-containing protein n=1 Tax=Pseudonocardia kujensis TaxID=1128675 RepID=UPI001E41E7DE|nr:helix-turn-helix transcriptional regulator [Pseudonocardia kujensis]MCE0767989.1 helix-turn-helix domain-containing protein [Pseudonocardia kujensis]
MTTGGGGGPAEGRAHDGGWSEQVNALGGFIRAQRQMAKLSLREMASMTRVSNAYLSQVERGLHQPSLKVLHSIADALHLNTEQLLQQAGWGGVAARAATGNGRAEPAGDEAGAGPCSVEEAVRAETRLTEEQKTALLGVYRSFLES